MRRLSRYGWRAAEPARRPVLFVNPRSGGGRAAQAGLVERARERGITALVLGPHDDLAALVDEAVAGGPDALGVAGGDGSLGVAAAAARGPRDSVRLRSSRHVSLGIYGEAVQQTAYRDAKVRTLLETARRPSAHRPGSGIRCVRPQPSDGESRS